MLEVPRRREIRQRLANERQRQLKLDACRQPPETLIQFSGIDSHRCSSGCRGKVRLEPRQMEHPRIHTMAQFCEKLGMDCPATAWQHLQQTMLPILVPEAS